MIKLKITKNKIFGIIVTLYLIIFSISSCKLNTNYISLRKPFNKSNHDHSDHITIFSASLKKATKAFSYNGATCQLKSGLKFEFINFIYQEKDNIEFELATPGSIKNCSLKRHIIIPIDALIFDPPLSLDLITQPTEFDNFIFLDHIFDFKSRTWSKSNNYKQQYSSSSDYNNPDFFFPFENKPLNDYKVGGRQLGALRRFNHNCNGLRRHAGVDLTNYAYSNVRAVTHGTILDSYHFYQGTYALVVDHYDFIIRYGEVYLIDGKDPNLIEGDGPVHVKAGENIAKVGILEKSKYSMLHFEMYKGNIEGSLSSCSLPFMRRLDLLNPSEFIDNLLSKID